MKKRCICGITTASSDYDLLKNVFSRFNEDNKVEFYLLIAGSHLSKQYGYTIKNIYNSNFNKIKLINTLSSGDSRKSMSYSISNGIKKFSKVFYDLKADAIILLGDRYEALSASIAAKVLNVKIIHFSGGDTTKGSLDDYFRYNISSLSDFHFVKLPKHKTNLSKYKIDKKNIDVIGSLNLENVNKMKKMTLSHINKRFNTKITKPFALVSFHSSTNPKSKNDNNVRVLLKSFNKNKKMFYVFTTANADFGGKKINSIIRKWTKKNYRNSAFVENFGGDYYLNLINLCKCMIGNSSSGIVESGYFKKPVINILPRQKGRDKNINVIDVNNNAQAISKAVNKAISKKFKKKCEKIKDIFKVMKSYKISNYVYSRIKALKFI